VCYTLAGAVGNSQNLTTEARSVGSGLFLLLGMGAHTWSVIDGVNTANAHNRMLLGSP
jgi:hypothetical protein